MPRKWEILLFIILIIYASLFVFDAVFGIQYREVCDDTSNLRRFMNFTTCERNSTGYSICTDYNFTQLKECEFGCDNITNTCRESQITEYGNFFFYLILIIIGIGVIIALYKRV